MTHFLGYSALVLNLISMSMKNVLYLRIFSMVANAIYVIYGILLDAPPFVIGCSIAVCIHLYHIHRIKYRQTSHRT